MDINIYRITKLNYSTYDTIIDKCIAYVKEEDLENFIEYYATQYFEQIPEIELINSRIEYEGKNLKWENDGIIYHTKEERIALLKERMRNQNGYHLELITIWSDNS